MNRVYLQDATAISAAGDSLAENWQALCAGQCFIPTDTGIATLSAAQDEQLQLLRRHSLRHADRVTLLAAAATKPLQHQVVSPFLLIAGSARGAAATLEQEFERFQHNGKTSTRASPRTSLGMLAALLSQQFNNDGLSLSLSATCATGLHAIGISKQLLTAGTARQALTVCSEAHPTACVTQMLKSAGVFTKTGTMLPMHPHRTGMASGEGAAAVLLNTNTTATGIYIAGYGYATETQVSMTGITGNGLALAITRALADARLDANAVQLIIGHGAATKRGDAAEWQAYQQVFADAMPPVRFHKWCAGHLLGAAALYSVALAYQQMQHQVCFQLPYLANLPNHHDAYSSLHALPANYDCVLICAMGFGGNCVAIILARDTDTTNRYATRAR